MGNYEFMKKVERVKGGELFSRISFEGVNLSIQGSYGHYCSPQDTLPVEKYTHMEVAVIKGEGQEFLSPEELELYFNIPKGLKDKMQERFDGMVYGHVPVEVNEELYQELK